MKIAFVANTSWNIYNFRKGLVHYFLNNDNKVIVLTPQDDYTEAIESWGLRWIETPVQGTGSNPLRDYNYFKALKSAFKRERPDVVLSFTIKANIYACLATRTLKIPVICNVSGLGTVFLVDDFIGKMAVNLYRIAFRYAQYVFFQNSDDKVLFLSKVQVDEDKVGLLPGSGINLDDYPYSVPSFEKPTRLLMISRLIIEKGVREFAKAASHFAGDPNISFTLVGRFEEDHSRAIDKSELEEWIRHGWLNYHPHSDEIKRLIEEHEVIVLPSYREGTPRTLLEGAAMGRPLLGSDVPGCKEVIADGFNGYLFKVKSAEDLINKIKKYLALKPGERESFSKNSRELVETKFDEKKVVNSYKEIVYRMMSAP